jgi:hypothetical protein
MSPVRELDMIRPQPLRNAGTTINRLTKRKNALRTDLLSIQSLPSALMHFFGLCRYYYFSLVSKERKMNKPVISLNSWKICGVPQAKDPEEALELLGEINVGPEEKATMIG